MPDRLDFAEDFALSDDRARTLEELIPGTDDHAYYNCLHAQHTGDLDAVDGLLRTWIERHGRSDRVRRIEHRQALLKWERDPAGTRRYLKRTLGLSFDHQRVVEGQVTEHPTALDAEAVRAAMHAHAWAAKDLGRFSERALYGLLDAELDPDRRRALLSRLQRPDHPKLVEHVRADLAHDRSGGFGSLGIHELLLLDQLEELARTVPKLRTVPAFVHAWVARLQPGAGVEWTLDLEARARVLDRYWALVQTLDPAFTSLKVHVLYHRLEVDLHTGVLDPERLQTYLALPRQASYASKALKKSVRRSSDVARLTADFSGVTGLPTVGDDEELVRALLEQVFVEATDTEPYTRWIAEPWLRRVFATTKLLAGRGDAAQWSAMLRDTAYEQALRERVDLLFAPTTPQVWAADAEVALEVDVKNARSLTVKVFRIDALNLFLAGSGDVDTSIDLDGLVATWERVHTYDEPPLRRVRRRFELSIPEPGVYVVELIGNGRSSRALVRKGTLRALRRVGVAGHALTVLDETGAVVSDAEVWLSGRAYPADEHGEVLIPFSTRPSSVTVLLRGGGRTALETLQHRAEHYALHAGLHVEREGLRRGARAEVLVRPLLAIHGAPASLELLEDVVLTVTSTDRFGTAAALEVRDPDLLEGGVYAHPVSVPDDLASLAVQLSAKVRPISTSGAQRLTASADVAVNGIDRTEHVEDAYLTRCTEGYVLQVRGKTGEPRAHRPLTVTLRHRDYTGTRDVVLQSDARGRVELGALAGFTSVSVALASGVQASWPLERDGGSTLPRVVHAVAGEPVVLPWCGSLAADEVALLERRGSGYRSDLRGLVHAEPGAVRVTGLPQGDHLLVLGSSRLELRVEPGDVEVADELGWIAGEARLLERGEGVPPVITAAEVRDGALHIEVGPASDELRVHVVATRLLPRLAAHAGLGVAPPSPPRSGTVSAARSAYVSGRDIGDEYRYILDRRRLPRRPGNLLGRPGLLLNPWAVRETATDVIGAASGGAYRGEGSAPVAMMAGPPGAPRPQPGSATGFSSLDWIPCAPVVRVDLVPDADGVVRVPLDELGAAQVVEIVATDGRMTSWRRVALPERVLEPRDLRLHPGLDPERHFIERRAVAALDDGDQLVLEDITTSALEVYGTLGRVYALFQAASGEAKLGTFGFALRWPQLPDDEQRRLYSEHACHELSFFLSRKDPAFFEGVIRPYLRNKRHKTFLDRYLLGDDLSAWLEPWAYGRLNVVERILLGQRCGDDPTRQHVRDRVDLLPPDPEGDAARFRTALGSSALETEDAFGFADAVAEAEPEPMAGGGFGRAMAASAPMELAADLDLMEEAEDDEAPEPRSRRRSAGKKAKRRERRRDLAARKPARRLYRSPQRTEELAENDYHHLRFEEQGPELVVANRFWRHFAEHAGTGPFLSRHVALATGSFTEMMLALAVLDLPFDAAKPEHAYEGARMELVARSPALVFHRQLCPVELEESDAPVLVSQGYLRSDDRYRYAGGEQLEKYVAGELLVQTPYVCQVVLTNPSSARQKLDVLLQIPRGSVPVGDGFATRSRAVLLGPHATASIEYGFAFPTPGSFAHFGVHVARNEALVAFAQARELTVVEHPTEVDETSWRWVSQNADLDALCAFLDAHNLERLDLSAVAWRMRERAAYDRILALLERRHAWDAVLWSYAVRHHDAPRVAQLLLHEERYLDGCGPWLESPLFARGPVERGRYAHLEYAPLVNARAHLLGGRHTIPNDRFRAQQARWSELMGMRPELDGDDWLSAANYLFLQDRVEEGLDALGRVDPEAVESRLQLAYLRAYAAFYGDDPEEARALALEHADHPVDRWRTRFQQVLAQLDEAAGAGARAADAEDPAQAQDVRAAEEPALSFELEHNAVELRTRNVDACRVHVYEMDIELLFSRQPFVKQQAGRFSFIAPNATVEVALDGTGAQRVPLPAEYAGRNVVVEVEAAGARQSRARYAHGMDVQVVAQYGQLQVRRSDDGRPLRGAYVKVYARFGGGEVAFYKDGYTDLRGRFDYASLSTDELDRVERLAMLVLDDTCGARIEEAEPPPR